MKILLVIFCCLSTASVSASSLIIKNVNVISTIDGQISRNMNVLIENDSIKQVSHQSISQHIHQQVIDGTNKYLIPGLIDSHVHLAKVPGMNGGHKRKNPELAEAYLTQQPRSYLYFGYTTVIDLNEFSPKHIANFKNAPLHPDVYTCSQHLDIANGHGMFEEDPKTRLQNNPNFLYDHYQAQILQDQVDVSKHTAKETVGRIKDAGSVCIKTYYENGYGGSEMADYDIPTPDIIRDVVVEGRKLNIPTVLHGNSWESYRFALLTDVDIIGHGLWHWGEYRHAKSVPPAIQETLKEIAKRKIGYQPTLHALNSQRNLFDSDYLENDDVIKAYPKELIEWYKSKDGKWFQSRIKQYFPSHMQNYDNETMYQLFDKYLTHTGQALKAISDFGGNLLLGTDTIIGQSFANAPGYSGYEEMQEWRRFGVPLSSILKAATIGNAKAFKLDDQYGTVEAGKVANLLLLTTNPLEKVEAYNNIDTVIIRGRVIKRSDLAADF